MTDLPTLAGRLTKAQRWVPHYEGRYLVDEQGDVYSVARSVSRINRGRQQAFTVPSRKLVQCLNRNKYLIVRLYKNNKGQTFEVHRLICRAFHGECPDGMEAAHVNGDKSCNAANNVAWKTRSDNMVDKRLHGTHLIGTAVPTSKLTADQAIVICKRALAGESCTTLAREFGVSESNVRQIRAGTLWADYTLALRQHLMEGRA